MAKSVQELPIEIQQYIEVYEWDMRTLEGNSRLLQLKGKCLPAIALDDKLVYESLIPGQEELIAEITRLWQLKNSQYPGKSISSFYEKNHQNYFDSTFKIESETFLSPLAKHLNTGDSILDVGCGSGRDLLWGVQQGYEAVGFEQSPGLAKLAREHSHCTVIDGDFISYDFSKLSFTALVFVGSLVHLSKEQLPIVLGSTRRALVPGGLIFITMKEGDGSSQSDDGRVFTLWSRKDLEQVFTDQHLQVLEFSRQTSKIRSDDVWLGYVLRSNKSDTLLQKGA